MMNFEKFKTSTLIRLIVMSISTLLPIIVILVMNLIQIEAIPGSIFEDILKPDMIAISYTVLVLLEAFIIYKIVTYARIILNNDFAEKIYISRQDERNKFISGKVNNLSAKIFLYALGVISIFSAFTNRLLCYTVLIILAIYILIYTIVNIVYHKKY